MSLSRDQTIELVVEKPAAGGRMIARHEGQVVLVRGAIPGERVQARIERADKRLAFADTVKVIEPSTDRRDISSDPLCGGCLYAYIAYERQVALKADVIADAFVRIGRIPLQDGVTVAASPERGYRMRARFHIAEGRPGFYREGTHEWCEARDTGQVLPETLDAVTAAIRDAEAAGLSIASAEVSENVAADQRAILLERAGGGYVTAGDPSVADPLAVLTSGRAAAGELRRRPASFFQGNRYLIPALVGSVLDAIPAEGSVLDLYAGVGLFAICLAATGRGGITAVEGDRTAGSDLRDNAAAFPGVEPVLKGVEDYLAGTRSRASTIIVDPPRTGISREAMESIAVHGASRVVYVSCDPATMARDARRLLDAGYRLLSLQGFDLFPNTPHVETLGVFEGGGGEGAEGGEGGQAP